MQGGVSAGWEGVQGGRECKEGVSAGWEGVQGGGEYTCMAPVPMYIRTCMYILYRHIG